MLKLLPRHGGLSGFFSALFHAFKAEFSWCINGDKGELGQRLKSNNIFETADAINHDNIFIRHEHLASNGMRQNIFTKFFTQHF